MTAFLIWYNLACPFIDCIECTIRGRPIVKARVLSICSIIILSLFIFSHKVYAIGISVSASQAIVLDQKTGEILFSKNHDEKTSIASITKVMTAIIAIESGMMDETTAASLKAIYTEGSSIYLEQGESMTIEDLVYGLMLRSGNDSAVAIAEHVGGSEEGFVHLMNDKAKWIGMTNTSFRNSHGLEAEDHYSTAYDMALLMQYAMNNETFRTISGTKIYKAKSRTYSWLNKNKLLTRHYEYTTGGKTGYTKRAGRTLLTTASKDGHDLIAVTLNAPDDWNDHIAMYEYGFQKLNSDKPAFSEVDKDNSFYEDWLDVLRHSIRIDYNG